MKDFLKRFFDVFVALCLVTFLILITYYSETCNSFFAICLIFVSVFTIALTFVNQYFKMKNKLTKWLYLLGISSSGIYLILNACRYFAINQLINSKIYSIFCMLFLALSIVIFVLLLYTTIRLMFNKNYTFQSFDIIGIKKILNLLACISVTIIMTYPTHFKTYYLTEVYVKSDIFKVVPNFNQIWVSLVIVLGIYIVVFTILDTIEKQLKNKN